MKFKDLHTYFFGNKSFNDEKGLLEDKYINDQLLAQWEDFSDLTQEKAIKPDRNKVWNQIQFEKKKNNSGLFFKIAASVVVILSISFFAFWIYNQNHTVNSLMAITEMNEKKVIELPDGSNISLNKNSILRFKETKKERLIALEGEAFFKVAKNPNKPFIVSANQVQIKVLGTQFNVKAYSKDQVIKTTLEEGKIEFSLENQDVKRILKPNEQITYYKKDQKIISETVIAETESIWKSNELKFENENLASVLKKIENWYNIQFIITDSSAINRAFTFKVTNEKPEEIFFILEKITPLKFQKINDKTYQVVSK